VKASLGKYVARTVAGAYKESQYRTVYFHTAGSKWTLLIRVISHVDRNAVDAFRKGSKVFVVMVATERLDAEPVIESRINWAGCRCLPPMTYDMYQLVRHPARLPIDGFLALPRHRHLDGGSGAVSRHYHGRTYPQSHEWRGHQDLFLTVDDPELEPKLLVILNKLKQMAKKSRMELGAPW